MIIAKLTQGGAELFAKFYHEDSNQEVAYTKVIDIDDAKRILEFHNRKFITSTITNWLKQRHHTMQMGKGLNADKSHYLVVSMKLLQFASYRQVLKFIRDNISLFNLCIPWDKTKVQYKYYEREIKPILDFCTPNKL